MKIKMLTLCAGPEGVLEAGKSYDLDKGFAQELIAGRYAVAVEKVPAAPSKPEVPEIETTEARPAPEKALSARGKKKSPTPPPPLPGPFPTPPLHRPSPTPPQPLPIIKK